MHLSEELGRAYYHREGKPKAITVGGPLLGAALRALRAQLGAGAQLRKKADLKLEDRRVSTAPRDFGPAGKVGE